MRFSVIIPVYNKAPYVAKAIGSVLTQSFSDFELIVMDDGSSDASFEVASESIQGKVNCHLYQQRNSGVSLARNRAAELSVGDYLCFLDADDWWDSSFLERVSRMINEYPEAGIYGTGYSIINETRHKTRVADIGVEPGFEKGYINYCQVYASRMYMPLWTGAVCIPRSVFNEMGGFKPYLKLGEDFDLWIRIALKYKVAFLNEPLSNYNQDAAPQWRAVGRLQDPRFHILWNLEYLEKEEKTNPDYKQLIDNLRTFSLLPYLLSKQYREDARRELCKVEWTKQPPKVKDLYQKPIVFLKTRDLIRRVGSEIKQRIVKL